MAPGRKGEMCSLQFLHTFLGDGGWGDLVYQLQKLLRLNKDTPILVLAGHCWFKPVDWFYRRCARLLEVTRPRERDTQNRILCWYITCGMPDKIHDRNTPKRNKREMQGLPPEP